MSFPRIFHHLFNYFIEILFIIYDRQTFMTCLVSTEIPSFVPGLHGAKDCCGYNKCNMSCAAGLARRWVLIWRNSTFPISLFNGVKTQTQNDMAHYVRNIWLIVTDESLSTNLLGSETTLSWKCVGNCVHLHHLSNDTFEEKFSPMFQPNLTVTFFTRFSADNIFRDFFLWSFRGNKFVCRRINGMEVSSLKHNRSCLHYQIKEDLTCLNIQTLEDSVLASILISFKHKILLICWFGIRGYNTDNIWCYPDYLTVQSRPIT